MDPMGNHPTHQILKISRFDSSAVVQGREYEAVAV
jgi:hypothetical protein